MGKNTTKGKQRARAVSGSSTARQKEPPKPLRKNKRTRQNALDPAADDEEYWVDEVFGGEEREGEGRRRHRRRLCHQVLLGAVPSAGSTLEPEPVTCVAMRARIDSDRVRTY